MQTVWKFPLVRIVGDGVEVSREVLMPLGAHALSVLPHVPTQEDPSVVNLYALVDTSMVNQENELHRFQIVGTGHDVEEGFADREDDVIEFLGSVQVQGVLSDGYFHIFEVREQPDGD